MRKPFGWGGGWNTFIFTTKFPTRFSNAVGICIFYMILLIKFTRPQKNLVMGVGFGIFSFSPKDSPQNFQIM